MAGPGAAPEEALSDPRLVHCFGAPRTTAMPRPPD
jgi:hypothetical protein